MGGGELPTPVEVGASVFSGVGGGELRPGKEGAVY
jgi:hypothetical protein